MKFANVQFKNTAGGTLKIYFKQLGEFRGECIELASGHLSGTISGILLTVDIIAQDTHYTCDFTRYQPEALLVDHESPYVFSSVLSADRARMLLVLRDNSNGTVFERALREVQ